LFPLKGVLSPTQDEVGLFSFIFICLFPLKGVLPPTQEQMCLFIIG
jgi:hypothetical protein